MSKSSAQFQDQNGYLLVKGCPVSSYGIFDYSAAQVGETEDENNGDLNRIVKVFRPEESLTDPELIKSLELVPVIDEHDYLNGDPEATEDDGMAPEDKGVDGVMTGNVYFEDPWLRADLKIFSRRLQRAIRGGKKDLSLGYMSRFTRQPGEYKGQPYEYVQTNMRGNHIALVPEGRVAGARVLDGLVFDSMRLDIIPSKNQSKDSAMENEDNKTRDGNEDAAVIEAIKQLLPKLQALCEQNGGEGEGGEQAQPGGEGDERANAEGGEGDNLGEVTGGAGNGGEGGGSYSISDFVKQLDELMPKLREKAGVASEAGTQPGAATGDEDLDGDMTGDELPNQATGTATSSVTGVETNAQKDVDVGGKASPGPGKGEHATGDAAVRRFYADLSTREHYYGLISREVGAFDHKNMTSTEVLAYGSKKLGLKAPKGAERVALDAYFLGKKAAPTQAKTVTTGDSADNADALGSFLKGY